MKGQLNAFAFISGGATNQITTNSTVDEKGKIAGQAVVGKGFWARFIDFADW